MDFQQIVLVSFGGFEKKFLNLIADAVSAELHTDVLVQEEHLDISEFFDPNRRQYNGDLILKKTHQLFQQHFRVIGLFNVDLFIPILTFIYGQAMLNGRTGVVSAYRLDNERYGLIKNKELLFQRIVKEIIHELGHTFGLIHCHTPNCVMRSSTYVEDIDQKTKAFCKACIFQLENQSSSLN
ncbi:MAG: archaemetzincin family Zn-dependent metalloprotease [Prolixibacteraceae bacterium]